MDPQTSEEGISSSGILITLSCEQLCGCSDLYPILCKDSKHSWPLSHVTSTFDVLG